MYLHYLANYHAKHVCLKCNAFSSADCGLVGGSEKSLLCGQVTLFKIMIPLRLHACTQRCSPLINGLVDDALQNASPCIDDSLLQSTSFLSFHFRPK